MQYIISGTWKGNLGLGLAERELNCLMSVASGMTDKEIARRDGLSPRSIKGRIESAMFKLDVYKRPALIAEAMRRGIITILCSSQPPSLDPRKHSQRDHQDQHTGVFLA